MALRVVVLAAIILFPPAAAAQDVALIGTIGDKAAILSFQGGEPRTVRVGQKVGGVTVVSVDKERATVDIGGKKVVLLRGQHASASSGKRQSVVLSADTSGHFMAEGAINGHSVRMMVDTGATVIALPAREAQRMRIDYLKGRRGVANTAGGQVTAWGVRLDTVRIGDIEVNGVDAMVIEQGLEVILLGMSFLNRMEMKRDGQTMMLVRRF